MTALQGAVFQDAEKLAVGYLRDRGFRFGTELPTSPQLPVGTVHRIGGVPVTRAVLDRARLQVSVWAATKQDARDTAASAQAALWAMPDTVPGVTDVEDDLGLSWMPDDLITPPRPRYLFGVALYVRPAT